MPLPAHLFLSCSGELFDTRDPDWSKKPLRAAYSCHCGDIHTTVQLKATLRSGKTAWPGGYPLYFIAGDGEALSFESVRENFREIIGAFLQGDRLADWYVRGCEINWEDSDLTCAHSGKPIESVYADEEADCAEIHS
jgi:hypothetical protein